MEGTMNDFAFGQTIIYYKEDIEKINRENNTTLILEQDNESCHKSKINKIWFEKMDGFKTHLIPPTFHFQLKIYGELSNHVSKKENLKHCMI